MATAIQLLRSAVPHLRPDPGVLADGMPMVNLAEESPGLYFRLANGTLSKIGPAHIGSDAPNASPQGHSGNSIGELWFDTTDANKISLKAWDGSQWLVISTDVSTISPTPPSTPDPGDLWYDSSDNELKYWNGTEWISTSSAPPGGADSQVQFNDSGEFGGSVDLTFNKTTSTLTTKTIVVETIEGNEVEFTGDVTLEGLNADTATFTGDVTANTYSGNKITLTNDANDATANGDLTAVSITSQSYDLTALNTLP